MQDACSLPGRVVFLTSCRAKEHEAQPRLHSAINPPILCFTCTNSGGMSMKMTGAAGVLLLLLLLPFASTVLANSTLDPPAGCATQILAADQACMYVPADDYVELHQQRENGGHQHQHHRRHGGDGSGSHNEEPRAFTDCCRWLRAVDEECVCQVLRSLPPALFVRRHSYKISIGNACDVTYKCGGF